MRYCLAICAALLLAGLPDAAIVLAQDQTAPHEARGSDGREPSGDRRRDGAGSQLLVRASALKAAGKCREAIAIYACFAGRGRGYEIAQLSLAQCLADEAALTSDPDTAAGMGRQALFWADRAADFGDPSAQGFLAYHYLAGDLAPADAAEGGKWFYVFGRNPRHVNLGMGRLPDGTDALAGNLLDQDSDQRARAGAEAWRPLYTATPAPPEMMPAGGCILSGREAEAADGAEDHGDSRPGRGDGKGKGGGGHRRH